MLRGFTYYYATYGLVAAVIALATTPVMRSVAFRLGAVDRGRGRRIHDGIVPRLGGGGIFLGFMLPLLFVFARGAHSVGFERLVGVLLAGTVIFVIGVLDDLRGAPVWKKLAAEVVAAVIAWSFGVRIEVLGNPFGQSVALGWLGLPVTVLWVVVITNAVNLIDGLDGLAATSGMLIAGTLVFFTATRDHLLILACFVLIGSLAGFLAHNFPPATIFMGDSGSLFVGFLLAALSIVASTKATAVAAMMLPILAFAHPLMDMLYAVLRRYHRGLPLGRADKEHIHHKLLEMGLSKKAALYALTGLNAVVAAVAISFVRKQGDYGILPLLLFVLLVVGGLRLFGYVEMRALTSESFKIFARNRRRRYVAYLLGRMRRQVQAAADVEGLRTALLEFGRDAGCERWRLDLALPGVANPVFDCGAAEGDERSVGIEYPILLGQRRIGTLRMLRSAEVRYAGGAEEIVEGVAEAVRGFVERRQRTGQGGVGEG